MPWRRERLPTPVYLLGEFLGQRSLAGYSPWGHKELDMTERLAHGHTDTRNTELTLRALRPISAFFLSEAFGTKNTGRY